MSDIGAHARLKAFLREHGIGCHRYITRTILHGGLFPESEMPKLVRLFVMSEFGEYSRREDHAWVRDQILERFFPERQARLRGERRQDLY